MWTDYNLQILEQLWDEFNFFSPDISFSDLRNQISIIIVEGEGDFEKTNKLLQEKLLNPYSIENEQLFFTILIMAPEISFLKDELNPDHPLFNKFQKLMSNYLKLTQANSSAALVSKYFRFMYNELAIGQWYQNLISLKEKREFTKRLRIEIFEFNKRTKKLDDYSDRIFQFINDLESLDSTEASPDQDNPEEPLNGIKAWILFFEIVDQKFIGKQIEQAFIDKRWSFGLKSLKKNGYSTVKRIAGWKQGNQNDKELLFKAISLLKGEAKLKAQKLYLELK